MKIIKFDKQNILRNNFNEYDYSFITNGNLIIEENWEDEYSKFIFEDVNSITIGNYMTIINLEFLINFPKIKYLSVDCKKVIGFETINQLKHLEHFRFTNVENQKLNFDFDINLKSISILNWQKSFSLTKLPKTLEYLNLWEGKINKWGDLLNEDNNLKQISLVDCNIENGDDLLKLNKLTSLALSGCKKISFSDSIINNSLKFIDIRGTNFKNLQWANCLKSIEVFCIENAKEIDSVSNLIELKTLKGVSITNNTIINDGDLSFIEELPKLKNCFITPRKHYSHKTLLFWNWDYFNETEKKLFEKKPSKSYS